MTKDNAQGPKSVFKPNNLNRIRETFASWSDLSSLPENVPEHEFCIIEQNPTESGTISILPKPTETKCKPKPVESWTVSILSKSAKTKYIPISIKHPQT